MVVQKIIKLFNLIRLNLFFKYLKYKVAASTEHYNILRSVKFRHLIDIGANKGQFALITDKCFPGIRIDSFEPLPEPAEKFVKLFENNNNVNLHRCAIGSKQQTATIHISNADDSSSLLPISDLQTTLFPGTEERSTSKVEVNRLVDVLSLADLFQPVFMKIDVQGYEMEVIHGCKELLNQIRYIYVECSFMELYEGQAFASDIIDDLKEEGFKLIGVYNVSYDTVGVAVQADFLFSND